MSVTGLALFFLVCTAALQVFIMFRKHPAGDRLSHWLLLAAGILLLGVTVYRSIKIRFVAVTNTWESLVFFSAAVALVLFFFRLSKKDKVPPFLLFCGSLLSVVLLALASSPVASSELQPPIPALQSGWLVLHVIFSFIGEAFFTVSFAAAIAWLVSGDGGKRRQLEAVMYNAVSVGYPIFTAGALVFGAVWAEYAWGSFWSWDPKETWALVTWLVYTAYLHGRLLRGMRGALSAWLLIIGFILMVFTFFGVNFLLAGLHSYT